MTALYIISFILLVVATIALLKLTPEQINKDINELFNKQQTLKDQALMARGMGIGVYFEEQNLDSLKAENETLLGFFSVMAQSESESS